MTLEEKIAQLYGVWVGASDKGGEWPRPARDMEEPVDLDALVPAGLGQLTRPSAPSPSTPRSARSP
ncbi:hypothetical protein SVIOM342S_03764 [Streptomyces violaceorubidus]